MKLEKEIKESKRIWWLKLIGGLVVDVTLNNSFIYLPVGCRSISSSFFFLNYQFYELIKTLSQLYTYLEGFIKHQIKNSNTFEK